MVVFLSDREWARYVVLRLTHKFGLRHGKYC
ncbi:Uncharacterised protein [Vibrio cholerae]|nr:Uncharacterised protein [Vibrio cholerae]